MQHPENSKLIKEALSSPIGSTSRNKARKVFSIMSKLHSSNDGAGGPGMAGGMSMSYNQPQVSKEPQYTPKGMVIFSKIPTPNITYGKRVPTPNSFKSFDGSGGPGVYDGQGGLSDIWNSAKNTFNNAVNSFKNPTPSNFNTGSDPNASRPTYSQPNTGYNIPGLSVNNIPAWGTVQNNNNNPSPLQGYTDANTRMAPNIMSGPSPLNPTPVTSGPYQTLGSVRENKIIPGLSVSDVPVWKPKSDGGLTIMGGKKENNSQISVPEKSEYPVYKSAEPNNGLSGMFTGIVDRLKNKGSQDTQTTPIPGPQAETQSSSPVQGSIGATQPGGTTIATGMQAPAVLFSQLGAEGATARTDRHNNPAAFTTDVAKQAGLIEGVDYVKGDAFPDNPNLFTARLIGDGVQKTIDVIDKIGFTTQAGGNRWTYTDSIPGANNNEWANLSNEQKVAVVGQMYDQEGHGGSNIGSYGNLAAAAKSAVNAGIGAGMFALANNPLETGKALQKTVWDRYNIDDSQKEINRMTAEGTLLPKDVTSYITARDEYLAQTDKQIDDYVNEMSTMSSDPATFQRANAHLNYLYTLRGRQNQTYIGFLNDAIDQHQAKLDSLTRYYNTNLAAAEQDIQTGEADYKLQASALADMYTAVEQAPTLALQKQLLEAQVLTAQTQFVTDNLKKESQKSFIEQGNLLEGYIWNADHTVIPKIDLVEEVRRYKDDPNNVDVTENTITDVYLKGVQNYMYAPEDKDAQTGKGITAESKMEVAKDAVKQLTNLSAYYQDIGDSNSAISALTAATDSKRYLSDIVSSNIVRSGNVPKIMEAVKSIDRGSPWYTFGQGRRAPLTQDAFTKNLANATGNALDESIAGAIYAVFQFASNNGENNKAGVDAFFYPTKSTENWTNEAPYDTSSPFTEEQFAQNIANIYAAQYKP